MGVTSNQVAILHSEVQIEAGLTSNQVAILKGLVCRAQWRIGAVAIASNQPSRGPGLEPCAAASKLQWVRGQQEESRKSWTLCLGGKPGGYGRRKSQNGVKQPDINYILTQRTCLGLHAHDNHNKFNIGSDHNMVMSNIKLDVEVERKRLWTRGHQT